MTKPSKQNSGKEFSAQITHRFTRGLQHAQRLAAMLAKSRASAAIDVADFLAGMYLYDWERLSTFWQETAEIEKYLQQICQISPQRWHRWMEQYSSQRGGGENRRPFRLFRLPKSAGSGEKPFALSLELQAVLRRAEFLTVFHDTSDDASLPILTAECVLLAMVQSPESDTGRRLFLSGLDVNALKQEALDPKHAPRH